MKYCLKLTTLLLFIISAQFLFAQNFNLEPEESESNIIGLKVGIPNFKNDDYITYSSFSGCYTPYALIGLKKNWSLYAEIPIIVAKDDYDNQVGPGNIFVSLRKNLNETKTSRISFGGYIPIIGKEKYLIQEIGLFSNTYRFSQVARAFTIYGNYAYHAPGTENLIFGVEAGPDVFIPIEEGDMELLLHFGAKAGYKLNNLWLWSEINNIMIVTESNMDFGDRLISQLVFGGQLKFNKVKPGVFYTFPLKDYMKEVQNGIIGLKLDINI